MAPHAGPLQGQVVCSLDCTTSPFHTQPETIASTVPLHSNLTAAIPKSSIMYLGITGFGHYTLSNNRIHTLRISRYWRPDQCTSNKSHEWPVTIIDDHVDCLDGMFSCQYSPLTMPFLPNSPSMAVKPSFSRCHLMSPFSNIASP